MKSRGGAGIGRTHGVGAVASAEPVSEEAGDSDDAASPVARGPRIGGFSGRKSSVFMRLIRAGVNPVIAVDSYSSRAESDCESSSRSLSLDSTGVVSVSITCPAAGPRVGGLLGRKSSGGAGMLASNSAATRAASRGGRGP